MKTTVEIADQLLKRAKRVAASRGTTLRVLIEDALRRELAVEDDAPARGEIRTHTFGGQGLQRGLSWDDWATLRSLAYEGRGG